VIDSGSFDGPGPARRPRGLVAWLCGVLALIVVAGAVIVGVHLRSTPDSGRAPTPLPAPTTAAPTQTPTPTPTVSLDAKTLRRQGLSVTLAARERAAVHHDPVAWLATVDPQQAAFRTTQQAVFANLVKLPLTRWHYTIQDSGTAVSAQRRAALGARAWVMRVDLAYRFGSADRADVHSTQYLTVVHRSTGWLVAADGHSTADGGAGTRSDTEIWDLGPLTVVTGTYSVVIGLTPAKALKPFADQADSAVLRVSAIWGSGWPRRVVVIVPRTQAQMGTLLGRSSDSLSQIAAVTTGELRAVAGSPGGGADQIIVNPAGFARLGPLGRRVVITHETTHVAVRASTPRQVSIWLSEGFADYVGYSGLGLSRTEVAADVLGLVRRGIGPTHLPSDEDFDATRTTIGPSYSAAWLACKLIVDKYGKAQLLSLYRAASGAAPVKGISASDSPDEATRAAFKSVLGVSQAAFTQTWLAYLTHLSRD
jgi:hypothetical protein